MAFSASPTASFSAFCSTRDLRRSPAVSNSLTCRSPQVKSVATESRVRPGSGPVIIRSSPSSVLTSVDFPAFGRPTMASFNGRSRLAISSSLCPGSSGSPLSASSASITSVMRE
jgi:hypothetical protein